MTLDVSIRRLRNFSAFEFDNIIEMFRRYKCETNGISNDDLVSEDYIIEELNSYDFPSAQLLVARMKGVGEVGFAMGSIYTADNHTLATNDSIFHSDGIFVESEYRDIGIASMFIEAQIEFAKTKGCALRYTTVKKNLSGSLALQKKFGCDLFLHTNDSNHKYYSSTLNLV